MSRWLHRRDAAVYRGSSRQVLPAVVTEGWPMPLFLVVC